MAPDDVTARGAAEPPLLDDATHTVSVYPGCGEAVIQNRPRRASREQRLRELCAVSISWKAAARITKDPVRSRQESARRAATSIRRWAIANKADRTFTFTLAPEWHTSDPEVMWGYVESMRRTLKAHGHDCMLIVFEHHESGVLHAHGIGPRWVDINLLRSAWGKGFVLVKRHKFKTKHSATTRSRILASYLAKYITKPVDRLDSSPPSTANLSPKLFSPIRTNGKTYSTSRGTAPERIAMTATSYYEALALAIKLLDSEHVNIHWTSESQEDWPGPFTLLLGVP